MNIIWNLFRIDLNKVHPVDISLYVYSIEISFPNFYIVSHESNSLLQFVHFKHEI